MFEGQFHDELYGFFNLVVWCTQGAIIENVKNFLFFALLLNKEIPFIISIDGCNQVDFGSCIMQNAQ